MYLSVKPRTSLLSKLLKKRWSLSKPYSKILISEIIKNKGQIAVGLDETKYLLGIGRVE